MTKGEQTSKIVRGEKESACGKREKQQSFWPSKANSSAAASETRRWKVDIDSRGGICRKEIEREGTGVNSLGS